MNNWQKQKLSDFMLFNPSVVLAKGSFAKKVSMEHLAPFTKKIQSYEEAVFSGGSKFQNGDTLVARITPCLENGKISYVDILEDNEAAFGSTEFIVLREKPIVSDSNFIFYLAISDNFRETAIQLMTGTSGRQRVETNALKKIIFSLPPLPTQRAIAATLSCLDDKIELNRRINANLEAHAQAIFKSWFVDFEPFKGGKFVDSELGRIPKGWRVGTIGDVITLQRGHDLPINKTVPGNYPVLSSTGIIAYHNTYTTRAPCIVLGRSGNIGNPRYYNFDCWAHNTTIYIRTYNCEPLWIFFILKQLDYSQYKGGSAVPTLNRNHVEAHTIIIPPDDIQLKFQSQISVIMDIIDNNINQSRALAAIRDTLLPKLMSGEIEVKEK